MTANELAVLSVLIPAIVAGLIYARYLNAGSDK